MRFDVVTVFPDMLGAVAGYGVTGKAVKRGAVQVVTWNPRDYTRDRHRTVDDRPYGGGPGMVMMAAPLQAALSAARQAAPASPVLYLSPQGRTLNQAGVEALARRPGLILLAGRYEGVDQRLIDAEVDEEWSIGDYVLSGGELAAMVIIDAVTRLLPGVLGHEDSAQQDSFCEGLLDCPHYTRPEVFDGRKVPGVLLGGDHGAIRRWRLKQALGQTWLRRPELLKEKTLSVAQRQLLDEFIRERETPADE
ncbi:MAG TPA: tRNA (guanosine(37)-N1)-methyltransferase TrmD [Gammaproteobacteria bacterium]|nr:tRNA (guanosine(37)-N1)-methyltransferase TrmD [Gammaproteobacteria bacterium]